VTKVSTFSSSIYDIKRPPHCGRRYCIVNNHIWCGQAGRKGREKRITRQSAERQERRIRLTISATRPDRNRMQHEMNLIVRGVVRRSPARRRNAIGIARRFVYTSSDDQKGRFVYRTWKVGGTYGPFTHTLRCADKTPLSCFTSAEQQCATYV